MGEMAGNIGHSGDGLSPEATRRLAELLAGSPRRLFPAELDGRTVWVKRFDAETRPLPKRLHAWLSPLLPVAFLRASPDADAAGLAAREVRKAARFAAAGIPVPAILWREGAVLALSQVATIVEPELLRLQAAGDVAGHDALLVEMAAALGRAHGAGLCHGRPHPRDMFRRDDGEWGFLDFEEEPEAAMPLAAAQARDVWLLFMQIAGRTGDERARAAAFDAWRARAPTAVVPELRRAMSVLCVLLPGLKALRPLGLGKDGRRLLDSILCLRAALRASPAAQTKPDRIGTPT